jgi:hypothetical protein
LGKINFDFKKNTYYDRKKKENRIDIETFKSIMYLENIHKNDFKKVGWTSLFLKAKELSNTPK